MPEYSAPVSHVHSTLYMYITWSCTSYSVLTICRSTSPRQLVTRATHQSFGQTIFRRKNVMYIALVTHVLSKFWDSVAWRLYLDYGALANITQGNRNGNLLLEFQMDQEKDRYMILGHSITAGPRSYQRSAVRAGLLPQTPWLEHGKSSKLIPYFLCCFSGHQHQRALRFQQWSRLQ